MKKKIFDISLIFVLILISTWPPNQAKETGKVIPVKIQPHIIIFLPNANGN
jgi:hypothetical protein